MPAAYFPRAKQKNATAKENVIRFFELRGFTALAKKAGKHFFVIGTPGEESVAETKADPIPPKQKKPREKILVLLTTDRIGGGDDELGRELMLSYINSLGEIGSDLWQLIFLNNGVKLAAQG